MNKGVDDPADWFLRELSYRYAYVKRWAGEKQDWGMLQGPLLNK